MDKGKSEDENPGRVPSQPVCRLLYSAECFQSIYCVLCSAPDAARFQGVLSNCLPYRGLRIPAASWGVLDIDSDAVGQITRQNSLLEGCCSPSQPLGPEAGTLYCVNYSRF